GLHTETPFYQSDMVVYYPFDPEGAKTLLAKLGFEDTDGDGFVNWTDGSLAGQNLEVTLHHSLLRTTDVSLTDSIVTMMQDVGIRVIPRPLQQSTDVVRDTCEWDWILDRGDNEYHVPFANLDWQAPLTARVPQWHQGTAENPQELLPFEEELVEIVTNIRTEPDTEVRNELLREYNRVATDNIYNVGLITIPAALIINKRIKNVPPGTPVLAYQWSEDAVMRERFWVAEEEQLDELFPETLPGIN
ncbi:MAG: ABC transporter substrate-binding protein, partial [Pseudomonadota bacterium]